MQEECRLDFDAEAAVPFLFVPDFDDGAGEILEVAGLKHVEQAIVGFAGLHFQAVGGQHGDVEPIMFMAGRVGLELSQGVNRANGIAVLFVDQ